LPPLTADGGGDVTGSSPGGGEVDHQDPLCLERGLAMLQLGQLGFNCCLLVVAWAYALCQPAERGLALAAPPPDRPTVA
jgi:hypothetical protein